MQSQMIPQNTQLLFDENLSRFLLHVSLMFQYNGVPGRGFPKRGDWGSGLSFWPRFGRRTPRNGTSRPWKRAWHAERVQQPALPGPAHARLRGPA